MRVPALLVVFAVLLTPPLFHAQQAPPDSANNNVTCDFDDEKQIGVQYAHATVNDKPPYGKVWSPGNTPMLLFTQAELTVANVSIPVGAYSMFVIPGKNSWTLVVNKNVTPGSKYDETQDLVRAPMETGQLSNPESEFSVIFGHIAPKQCSIRFYYGKTGTWTEFMEK